jgi:hypothetical protein
MTLTTLVRVSDHPGLDLAMPPGVYLHDLSGRRFWGHNAVFRVEGLVDGVPQRLRVRSATPSLLVLHAGDGVIEATWDGPDAIRFRGRGIGLRLTQVLTDPLGSALAFPRSKRSWRLQMGGDAHFVATVLDGELRVTAPRSRTGDASAEAIEADVKVVDVHPGPAGSFDLELTQYESGYADPPGERPAFDACVARTGDHFVSWLDRQPPAPVDLADARALAAYITWSCILGPRGGLARPSLFSSKNWMYSCWSWDQPYSAQALAHGLPDLAWDQVMTHFDLQHPDGGLPDLINDNGHLFGFAKPPNHGWGLRKLAAHGVVTDARLAELYPKLARATEWWLRYRDDDGDGLCEYFHGNDSGWDNATAFDMGFPVEGPDLASFLVIQMDVLADAAGRLGRPDEAEAWRQRADCMLDLMMEHLWDGEGFRVLRAGDHVSNPASRSLIAYLPMILGDRLPADVRTKLVRGFRDSDLLTEFGPATESPSSPLFARDGYWRGPIWGPTTLLIADGLEACGDRALAVEVARRFAETCRRSGFAENFDALSGQPLRDPTHTWTASSFLVLATRYLVAPRDETRHPLRPPP